MTVTLAIGLGVAVATFVAVWAASVILRDASIVDRFWGLGFVVVAITAAASSVPLHARAWLVLALVSSWGLRLSAHITIRNFGQGEDYRYRAMRKAWGPRFPLVSLATVFLLQAALLWLVSLPVQVAIASGAADGLGWLDLAGFAVWATGFAFEAIGDEQLRRFRLDPASRGRVMDRGLWRWTRHPNYFGDALLWWGLYLIAVAAGGWWTAVGPATMTWLLMRVSGAALLEKGLRRSRPEYDEYCRRTSAFFPRPPRL